jgi:arylsulfatase A-like enzyme
MLKRSLLILGFFASWLLGFIPYAEGAAAINDVYVIHFIIDGTNRSFFNEVLDSGKLPTIRKLFVEEGTVFTNALANFPSTSTTIYQSYTSGLLPGFSGIPHLERFDRKNQRVIGYLTAGGYLKINDDFINIRALLNPGVVELNPPATVFELLEGYPTYSLYSSFRRGAQEFFPKRIPSHALWSAYVENSGEKIDQLVFKKIFEKFRGGNPPRYTLAGLYSTDFLGHEYGAHSEWVMNALIQFDLFLKEFWALLEEKGLAEKTYIIVSADHGMHNMNRRFMLQEPLRGAGIFVKPDNPRIKDYTIYIADRGVSSTHIYVRHDGGWAPIEDARKLRMHPKTGGGTIDLIDAILNLEPSMLLIVRDGKYAARIFDKSGGQSRIECFILNSSDWCSYKIEKGSADPLEYGQNPRLKHLTDGAPHSTLEWKQAAAGEKYPDAVIQLSQIFFDGRGGDLFVIPKPAWGFRKVKAATHGSIIEDDMRVPFLMRGPTVPKGTFSIMRSTDVYPLLLEWFGLNIPKENYDGVNPFIKSQPESKEWKRLAAMEQAVANGENPHRYSSRNLLPLAKKELENRHALAQKLEAIKNELAAQKLKNDHLDIVNRMLELTRERISHMEKIVLLLSN